MKKIYTLNAARKQGMTEQTTVTALADGALNCWSVIMRLDPSPASSSVSWTGSTSPCGFRMCSAVDGKADTLERVKWTLWHGKPRDFEQTRTLITMQRARNTQSQSCKRIQVTWLRSKRGWDSHSRHRHQRFLEKLDDRALGGDKFGLHSVGRLFGQTELESETPLTLRLVTVNVNLVPPGYCLVAPVASSRKYHHCSALSRGEREDQPRSPLSPIHC